MDNQATTKLNVHVEKETICGCACTQYIPLPNKCFNNDGTWEKGKSRDQNLMCLGECRAFLLKYRKGSVLTNIHADNGVSKVSLDIPLNGIINDKVRYNKTSKYFHEIWVNQAKNVNNCVALQFDHNDKFDEFDRTLSSILNELKNKDHTFEYRLVAFKPLHRKVAKTDMVIKSIEEICNEDPDPGPDPAVPTPHVPESGQLDAQTPLGVPFSPAPYTPPSDVLTLYKNKMILKKADRFTFDSSEFQCKKETSSKNSETRGPIKSDSFLLKKMPSLGSIKRECVKLSEEEYFEETVYIPMRESVSDSDNQHVDDSGNSGGHEQVNSSNENNDLYENVFLSKEEENEVPLKTEQSKNSSTDFNTTVFLPMDGKNGAATETDQSQSSCQSSSTDLNTTVFLPMNSKNVAALETEQSQSSGQNSSTDFNTTVFLSKYRKNRATSETEQSESLYQNSSTDFNTTVFLPMEEKNSVPLQSEQSQLKQSDFDTTVFLPMTGSTDVPMATKQSQYSCQSSRTDFNSPVLLPTTRITKQNDSDSEENVHKSKGAENMIQQIKFLEEAINSCNKSDAVRYAAELATIGVNVTITINRK